MAAVMTLGAPPSVTSAAGVLSLLEESENKLRIAALERLNEICNQFWPEIADYLTDIESLYEDDSFPGRELAALVASRVFYHLEEYDDALKYSLGAGRLLNLSERTEYVEKMVAVAIDEYVKLRTENFEREQKKEEPKPIDPRLEDVVSRMFTRCLEDKAFKQGTGMALETRRLDMVKVFITGSDDPIAMLEYCQTSALALITSKTFREQVLECLISIHSSTPDVNYSALCQCYFILNDANRVADVLKDLLGRPDKEGWMMACQIAFDMVDNENQHFCNLLLNNPGLRPPQPAAAPVPVDGEGAPAEGGDAAPAPAPAEAEAPAGEGGEAAANLAQLRTILTGRASIDLNIEFLCRNNRTDLLLLETVKGTIDQKNSITHNGTVIAHCFMQCGTTSDIFLRKNLEWLAKASNWAKFNATASLGVIHKGNIKESKKILSTYLPTGGGAHGSPYSEGGSLYAMGLIHANHFDADTKTYLLEQLHNAQASEVLQHGACLGLGLVCMATADEGIYEELKQILYTDTAVAGEAAAYAIGLVMVGSASEKAIGELLAYAHETKHDKLIRACSLALAMMCFRQEDAAETLIQQMLLDKDPILRYGACYAIALAYVGTSQNSAIRRLLHISVSDVNDDVRRASVMALGFVMCNVPDQVPSVVKLLSESYNPHVRYAAAMAIGIACAGSALSDAHDLLQPLLSDPTDFVRQGALIAMGLLLMQTSEGRSGKVKEFRARVLKTIGDKYEDIMVRFGAVVANGILDASGRNASASFFSKSGVLRRGAAIGFLMFSQMWYWFPLIHMFSLTLTPTALIGLNEKLKIPKNFSFKSSAKPSLFAYPEPMQPPKKEETAKAANAVLSTASKAKALKEKKDKEEKESDKKGGAAMDVDADDKAEVDDNASKGGDGMSVAATQGTTIVGSTAGSVGGSDLGIGDTMEVDNAAKEGDEKGEEKPADAEGNEKKEEKDGEKKEPEPTSEMLSNPCRVLPQQMQYISFPVDGEDGPPRYTPLLKNRHSGFLLLRDTKPDEPEELFLEDEKPTGDDGEKEPDPPEPFEWTDDA